MLIGFDIWGDSVEAYDRRGRRLWSYPQFDGVDSACVVNGEAPAEDSVAVGYNGDSGVRLLDAKGRLRWHAGGPGNVDSVAPAWLSKGGRAGVICSHSGKTILVFDADGR